MFCRNCGKEISDTAKFCKDCGQAVVKDSDKTVFVEENPDMYKSVIDDAPDYNDTVMEEQPPVFAQEENYVVPKTRKRPHAVLSVFCVILMLVVFGLEMVFGGLLTVKLTTSKGTVRKAIESVEFASLEIEIDGEEMTFAEAIVSEITDENVDEHDIERLVEDFEGEELFVGIVLDLSDYMFNGGDAPEIDVDDVMDVIDDNEELIEDVTGTKISNSDKKEIENVAEDFVREFNDTIEDIEGAEEINEFTLNFGLNIMTTINVVVLLFILAILVLCYKLSGSGIYRAFRAYAIPTGITGVLFVISSLVIPGIINAVNDTNVEMVESIVSGIIVFPLYAGIILLVACVLLIVAAVVSSIYYNKKTK